MEMQDGGSHAKSSHTRVLLKILQKKGLAD